MLNWVEHHLGTLATVAFVVLAVGAVAIVRRDRRWLLPVPLIVGLIFWKLWEGSGYGVFFGIWSAAFLYLGLFLGLAMTRVASSMRRRGSSS